MKPCPGCSAPVRPDSTFCTKCGFRLDAPGSGNETAVGQIGQSLPTGQFAAGAVVDGKYKVERILGEGGMGMVYVAKSIHTDVEVVIKAVRPEIAHREDIRERTLAEGKALARIDHPNVVQLKSVVVTGKELLLVMQYIEGENLEDRIIRHTQQQTPMALGEALTIFRQILRGVAAAHAEGVIHRDIKPANVLIRAKDGMVKVTDFGIAKPEEDAQAGKGQTRGIIGTVNYMSPEQVTGRRDLDRRVDIYALGIVLFEMLTGLLPFDADNTYEILKMHVDDPLPSATVGRAHLPALLDGVLQKACAKDRDHRYGSCEEFLSALEGMEEAVSGAAPTTMVAHGVQSTVPEMPMVPSGNLHPHASPIAAQFVDAVAHGYSTQPSPQMPMMTPYGAPQSGYAPAQTAQRHGTITGQAAELPASQVSGSKAWLIPVVLAATAAAGVTVAVVAGVGPFAAADDDETTEPEDDEPKKKKKKPDKPATTASASASSSVPQSPLASLVGEWQSKSSGARFKAVQVGDRVEFQIVDASAFAAQNYLEGEARFVLRASDADATRFLVEDRVRPLAPSNAPQGFSAQSRATCIVPWSEVDYQPLMADLVGDRLDVDAAQVGPKASNFVVSGGQVLSCSDLKSATVTKLSVRIGLEKVQ